MFRKDGLFKKDCAWTWYFLYYLERWYLFPENMIFFPLRDLFSFFPFSRNTWRHNIFCVHVNVLRTWCQVSLPKNPKMILFLKKHQKVTEILDWNSTKGSSKTLYLHRDLYRRFHILLSSEKKKQTENLIGISLKLEFHFFFNLFGWRYSTMNNLEYFVPFSPQELCLEVCLKLFVH